ncbi:MAG: DUF805 domain-containing protein [Alphaproteobacteria bacterium]|nr:DUF805 domain-containing protein [Alphaproteobacteria bacterium]
MAKAQQWGGLSAKHQAVSETEYWERGMNFVDAVKSAFARFADFATRSSRSEYWWFMLFYFLVGLVVTIIQFTMEMTSGIIDLLVFLVCIVPTISVSARRLHDIGRSGWWLLIGLIPLIGALILIFWAVKPGEDGDNRFGANPLGAA